MSEMNNGTGSRWWRLPWLRAHDPDEHLAPYRRIAMQLHYELADAATTRSALLLSPTASPLCARGSLVLAGCLADALGRRVLLVDASPRAPEASRLLNSTAARGFMDYLADPGQPLPPLLLATSQENVDFLPAGTKPVIREAAMADGMKAFLGAAHAEHDFVVLSGGSVLTDPMGLALTPHVGCVLLSIVENETKAEDFDAAREALSHGQAARVAIVLAAPLRNGWFLKASRNGTGNHTHPPDKL